MRSASQDGFLKEMNKISSLYIPADFFMIRTPVHSFDRYRSLVAPANALARCINEPEFPQLLASAVQQTNEMLRMAIQEPEVAQALLVASPSLFASLHYLQQSSSSRRQARVYESLLRYLVRMSTRATPSGLFSGIAIGSLADETTAQIALPSIQRIRTRVDMHWLLGVVKNIEQNRDILASLKIIVNPSVYCVGSRVIVPFTDADPAGNVRMVTLRITPVVNYLLRLPELRQTTNPPLSYCALLSRLLQAFPQMQEAQAAHILQALLQNDVLLTDLRPPLIEKEPALYISERLHSLSAALPFFQQLEEVIASTSRVNHQIVKEPVRALQQLRQSQEKLSKDASPAFSIDTIINIKDPRVNKQVGDVAAQAAEILLRIARPSFTFSALRQYYAQFVERYGMDAEIPLLTLLSSETGLGFPHTYTGEGQEHVQSFSQGTGQDALLTGFLSEALNTGVQEIELNESMLEQLASYTPKTHTLPYGAVELYFQMCARSREELDNGNGRLMVLNPPGLLPGGRTFSRFYGLMDEKQRAMLKAYIQKEEALFPHVVFAELNYLFGLERDINVMLRPQLRSYEIAINTRPSVVPENVLSLDDLVVGVRFERFYLRSLRLGKEVVVCQSHALNTERTPPLCRFLLDASWSGYPGLSGFDWGCLRLAPFLPRVRYQQIVLSPASWRVHAFQEAGESLKDDESAWYRRVQQWRKQWSVPRFVYLVEGDRRFLLDLEHPAFLAEFRRTLEHSHTSSGVLLQEMLPDPEQLWLHNADGQAYVAEMVLPLILRHPLKKNNTTGFSGEHLQGREPYRAISPQERRQLPGDEWTSLKLYVPAQRQDDIITGPLKELVLSLQERQWIDCWFFVRYADPDTHLRVRFHAAHSQYHDQLLLAVLEWSRKLVYDSLLNHFCVEEYNREIERYGGPLAFPAIEYIFYASSCIASKLLTLQSPRQRASDPLVTAVWSLDHFFSTWGLTTEQRLEFVQGLANKYSYVDIFRSKRRLFLGLFLPEDDPYFSSEVKAQRELLRQISEPETSLLQKYAQVFRALVSQKEFWQSEQALLTSLAHMHLNRLLGIYPEHEKKVYSCWRHALESSQRYLTNPS